MTFTEKLERLMGERGLNKLSLSKDSGVPYTTIVNFWEKGSENIKLSTLKKLADYFNVSLDYLADDEVSELEFAAMGEMINLPIVGRISCGDGTIAYEEIEGYEATPKEWLNGGEYFYLRAKGDSMTGARVFEGDLVLIRRQEEVENGEIAAVIIGDQAYLKRVYVHGNQLSLHSESLTSKYDPIYCLPSEARIIGRLKKIVVEV